MMQFAHDTVNNPELLLKTPQTLLVRNIFIPKGEIVEPDLQVYRML